MISRTQKFWDKQASRYYYSEKQFDSVFKVIISQTKNHLSPSDNVLDFGCATGSKTIALAESVDHIHGLDISSEMIKEADKKIIDNDLKNIHFTQGDLFDKELKEASFDKIISYGVIHLLDDCEKVIARIHDLLKTDGLFIASTACLKSKMAFKNSLEFKAYLLIKNVGFFPLHLNVFTPEKVENLITSQGFQILKAERIFHGITISFIIARKKERN